MKMLELRESNPGERERFFEIILGWPVGHGTCWVSTGDKTRMNLKDLGNIAGLCGVADPQIVVDLGQIVDAPSDDDLHVTSL